MNIYRQGDVLVVPVKAVPAGAETVARERGRAVLAHGEVTGHHHSIVDGSASLVTQGEADELRMWLRVTGTSAVALEHQEHATIMVPPGVYEVVRQREYTPEEIRRVMD